MNNIQRLALFAFLFLLGFIIINHVSCKTTIESYGGAKAKAALTKLAASSEKEIADPAKQALTRIKK